MLVGDVVIAFTEPDESLVMPESVVASPHNAKLRQSYCSLGITGGRAGTEGVGLKGNWWVSDGLRTGASSGANNFSTFESGHISLKDTPTLGTSVTKRGRFECCTADEGLGELISPLSHSSPIGNADKTGSPPPEIFPPPQTCLRFPFFLGRPITLGTDR